MRHKANEILYMKTSFHFVTGFSVSKHQYSDNGCERQRCRSKRRPKNINNMKKPENKRNKSENNRIKKIHGIFAVPEPVDQKNQDNGDQSRH